VLKFRVTWFASFIHWSVVLWYARKPNWLVFSKFLPSVCFWIVLKTSFSNSLPLVDKRPIGRKCGGNLESAGFRQSYDFCTLPRCQEVTKPKAVIE
jgi:hypothetical protein